MALSKKHKKRLSKSLGWQGNGKMKQKKPNKKNARHGSGFESFLAGEGILEECRASALKYMVAHELELKMANEDLSKSEVAKHLKTSRSGLDRILDHQNTSITLQTLANVINYLGKYLQVSLLPIPKPRTI